MKSFSNLRCGIETGRCEEVDLNSQGLKLMKDIVKYVMLKMLKMKNTSCYVVLH